LRGRTLGQHSCLDCGRRDAGRTPEHLSPASLAAFSRRTWSPDRLSPKRGGAPSFLSLQQQVASDAVLWGSLTAQRIHRRDHRERALTWHAQPDESGPPLLALQERDRQAPSSAFVICPFKCNRSGPMRICRTASAFAAVADVHQTSDHVMDGKNSNSCRRIPINLSIT